MEPLLTEAEKLERNLYDYLHALGFYPTLSEVRVHEPYRMIHILWWQKTSYGDENTRLRQAIMDYLFAHYPGWSYDVNL